MSSRAKLVALLNQSGLSGHMTTLAAALSAQALSRLSREVGPPARTRREEDRDLLNHAGPALGALAVDYAVRRAKELSPTLNKFSWNGSPVHNFALAVTANDADYQTFGNSLRQYLIARGPQGGGLDAVLGARHHLDEDCGYPASISPAMYRLMYDRDDVAGRVVDIYPDESFAVDPRVYEWEREDKTSPFEDGWETLCREKNLLSYLYRLDKVGGIGRYGCLLIGLDDGLDLSQPARGLDPKTGLQDPNFKGTQSVTYLRPFDEYLCAIKTFETDPNSPRLGLPKSYAVVFADVTADARGGVAGTQRSVEVHWTRVLHYADGLTTGTSYAPPRQENVFDRILDLRKIKGSSGEMFYQGGFPGFAFELDPKFAADNPQLDEDAVDAEIEEFMAGIRRYVNLKGVKAKTMTSSIHDPDKHVRVQLEGISARKGVPFRIWMGSEEARLAASQDKVTWNQRLKRRLRRETEPNLLRPAVQRFIYLRVIPAPRSGRFLNNWDDLNTVADEDKANLALKWTQALSQYVTTGVIHLIKPLDFLTLILGLSPADARRVVDEVNRNGGFAKLEKVDPSQAKGSVLGQQSGDLPEKRAEGAKAQGG